MGIASICFIGKNDMATVLEIGNGFDLVHGKKTGYMDSMRFVAGLC